MLHPLPRTPIEQFNALIEQNKVAAQKQKERNDGISKELSETRQMIRQMQHQMSYMTRQLSVSLPLMHQDRFNRNNDHDHDWLYFAVAIFGSILSIIIQFGLAYAPVPMQMPMPMPVPYGPYCLWTLKQHRNISNSTRVIRLSPEPTPPRVATPMPRPVIQNPANTFYSDWGPPAPIDVELFAGVPTPPSNQSLLKFHSGPVLRELERAITRDASQRRVWIWMCWFFNSVYF